MRLVRDCFYFRFYGGLAGYIRERVRYSLAFVLGALGGRGSLYRVRTYSPFTSTHTHKHTASVVQPPAPEVPRFDPQNSVHKNSQDSSELAVFHPRARKASKAVGPAHYILPVMSDYC